MNLGQLPPQVVRAPGVGGPGGRAGLPKPTGAGANFWGPGGGWFRRPVPPGPAPGALDGGGSKGPGGSHLDIWSQPPSCAPQGVQN